MTRPLLCVTVTAPSMAELRAARDRVRGADLVELRLDSVADPNVAGALEGRRNRVIVTCRANWEGGAFQGSEEERRRILGEALDAGAEYVDVEWRAQFDDVIAATGGKRIVLSAHDFERIPSDLVGMVREMRSTGAEVIKIAGKASRLSDCLPLLHLQSDPAAQGKAVLIAMGDAGLATRILAGRFGSAWTYAGSIRDVGQLSAAELLDDFHFRSLNQSTRVFGVVGSPIAHSVSPVMHNAAFAAAGIDAVYLPLPAADEDDFIDFARALGLEGASITIPFKVSLYERVDEVDDVARRIGAINTMRVENGRWLGRNTDAAGFLQPLKSRGISLRGLRASVLGAGGSARSVAIALAANGAAVTIHARDRQRAQALASLASGRVGEWPPAAGTWDLLVNCTPIGMHPKSEETPVARSALGNGLVYDLVYNPQVTRLLADAEAAGCDTIGGLDMLVGQAVEQFEWWTGTRPDQAVMRTAALARLSEFKRQ